MIAEISATGLIAAALKKPLEEIYSVAKGSTREKLQWLKNSSAIEKMYGRIAEVGTTRTIASRQPVSIRSIYYPAKIKTRRHPMAVDTANDLSDGANKHIVITGTVGQGKSVLLKYLCIREIETGSGIPLFIELRHASEIKSLNDLINGQLKNPGFDDADENLQKILFSRKLITLFLDGYDEVKRNVAASVRDEIHTFANNYANLRIIVSSRPSAIIQELDQLIGFSHLEINPLTSSDFDPFLKKIGVPDETRTRLITAIKSSQVKIRELLTTPLMLTLVVTACGTRPSLPDTLPDFYDALFSVMVATHDETKPGYIREKSSQLSNTQLEDLFKAFCFISKDDAGTTSLTPKEFSAAFSKSIQLTAFDCTKETFKSDLIDVVCLMGKDGLNTAFIHKSIQEYFASAFISELDDEDISQNIYKRIRHGDTSEWNQELSFLKSTDAYRYKKYYALPSLESLLKLFNYTPDKKPEISKKNIIKAVAQIDPSARYNSEREGFVLGIPTSIITKYGIKQYVFQAFSGVADLFEGTAIAATLDNDIELCQILNNNLEKSSETIEQISKNLLKLHNEKTAMTKEIMDRKNKLLAVVLPPRKSHK